MSKINSAPRFLQEMQPDGPWCLTAISPDKQRVVTKTFVKSMNAIGTGNHFTDIEGFLEEHNGTNNLYFHVNPVTKILSKKAKRENIATVAHLHVDVDPEDYETRPSDVQDLSQTEWLAAEQERILASLTTELPKGVPQPTVITFSGGGYQAFWKLNEPIPINGDLALAEDASLYNVWLEKTLGGDNCHNIDRLMRLPFTMNVPDEMKRAKGREPVMAMLMDYDFERRYDLSAFKRGAAAGKAKKAERPDIGPTIKTDDLGELKSKYGVADSALRVIGQGVPSEKAELGLNDRSRHVYHAMCEMARCGVPREVMLGLLLDKEWGVSEHVYDQKYPERYAQRQVNRGYDMRDADPLMLEMNEKHVQLLGVEAGIGTIVPKGDDPSQTHLIVQTEQKFKNRYPRKTIPFGQDKEGQPRLITPAEFWLHESNAHCRRIAEDRVIDTSTTERIVDWGGFPFFNEYQGWAVKPKAGDIPAILEHLYVNMAQENDTSFEYLLNLLAYWVQNPGDVAEVAAVSLGGRGVGKSVFWQHFTRLWGTHGLVVSGTKQLVGKFQGHLENKLFVFVDEGTNVTGRAGTEDHSQLKTILTSDTRMLEKKGIDARQIRNQLKVAMASNDLTVIPAGTDERRFFIHDVGEKHKKDRAFFQRVVNEFRGEGSAALLHMLLDRPLCAWHPAASIPETTALKRNKMAHLSDEMKVLYDMADTAIVPGPKPSGVTWQRPGKESQRNRTAIIYDFDSGNRTVKGLQSVLRDRYPGLRSIGDRALTQHFTSTEDGWGFTSTKTTEGRVLVAPDLHRLRADLERILGEQEWEAQVDDWQSDVLELDTRADGSGGDVPF